MIRVPLDDGTEVPLAPNPSQEPILKRIGPDGNYCSKILVEGGIQSGKSMIVAMDCVGDLPWLSDAEVFIMGPDFKQARKECEYIIDWTKQLGLFDPRKASLPSGDQQWRFKLTNGTEIKTFSAVNYRKMAGSTPKKVYLVEPGQIPDAEPFYLALARAGLLGCDLMLAGTLEGSTNWYAELAAKWSRGDIPGVLARKLPTWTNTARYPGGRTDQKIKDIENDPDLPRDRWLERYAGERVAPPGLVFGKTEYHRGYETDKHVRPIRFEPKPPDKDYDARTIWLPADTDLDVWIDWGWDHYYSVLFAAVLGDPVTVYICAEIALKGIRDTGMIKLAQGSPLWPRVHYAILDPATKQHHGGPLTTREYWHADPPVGAGLPTWADEIVPIQDGTDKIRALLEDHPMTGLPRLIIDPSCRHLQWEMREGYRNLIDLNGNSTGKPIDRNNDSVKAVHYGTHVRVRGLAEAVRQKRRKTVRRALPFA